MCAESHLQFLLGDTCHLRFLSYDVRGLTGPFKVNGVPLRRVNQAYVIGTSTKVDISGVNVEKFDDKYFAKEKKKKTKKTEGEFFETEKEVCCLQNANKPCFLLNW